MKTRNLFVVGLSIFFFVQCKNEQPKDASSATTTPSVSTTIKGFYKHLKGTIDSFPITMDLVQIKSQSEDYSPYNFRGHYYYDKYQQPIALYGEIDSTSNIILHEANWQAKDIYFTGKFDASGSFSGIWQDTSNKKKLPFTLKETYSDAAVSLDFHIFEDSLKLWKNSAKSPVAAFDVQLLLPSKNTEGGLSAFLKDKIFGSFKGDSIEKSYANLSIENLQNTARDTFFKFYMDTMAEEKPDSTDGMPVSANYAESSSMSILFNEKDLLSVGYGVYSYSGGAHGSYATSIATYDLAQKKVLKLNDIFLPKFEKTVASALTKAVRQQFNMKPKELLSSHLFDNKIEHTTNFCITKKGILFLYNPYEIAAYAFGEIELFIPFEAVKSVLNPRFQQ